MRRYLTLGAVFATIKRQQLRLTRVDKFQDPFEGSVPNKQIEDQALLLGGAASRRAMMNAVAAHYPDMATSPQPEEDPWLRITRLRRAMTRSAHASCWSWGEESESLWRLYCADNGHQGVGVAFRTSLARLEESMKAYDLYVSPIEYIKYHEAPAFTDQMDALLHKRHGFVAEHEFRLLKFDEAHFSALIPKNASVDELRDHICLDWIVGDVIEQIIISPYANETYEDLVRHTITDPNLASRVVLSELHERRYPPNF